MTRPDKANLIFQLVLLVVVLAWMIDFRMRVWEIQRQIDDLDHRMDVIRKDSTRADQRMDEIQCWQQQQDSKV